MIAACLLPAMGKGTDRGLAASFRQAAHVRQVEPSQGEKAAIALNELKEAVRALAREHGFALCRFARPKLPAVHAKGYAAWVDAGMHGSMDYMAEKERFHRRLHPETMLAGVQTVITLGMRHSPPPYTLEEARNARGRGVIAAYALGDDYHKVMKKRLKAFAGALDAMLGKHEQRVYVDTAPVLEHAFAEQSGLGWQGKHSLTIHRGLGSWFLLGEIFTTAAIAPDVPASNHCGTCRASGSGLAIIHSRSQNASEQRFAASRNEQKNVSQSHSSLKTAPLCAQLAVKHAQAGVQRGVQRAGGSGKHGLCPLVWRRAG